MAGPGEPVENKTESCASVAHRLAGGVRPLTGKWNGFLSKGGIKCYRNMFFRRGVSPVLQGGWWGAVGASKIPPGGIDE